MGKFCRHPWALSATIIIASASSHELQKYEHPAYQSISKSITSHGWLVHEVAGTALKTESQITNTSFQHLQENNE